MLKSLQKGASGQGIASGWQTMRAGQLPGESQGIAAPVDASKVRKDFMSMDRATSQDIAGLSATKPGMVPGSAETFTDHQGIAALGYRHAHFDNGERQSIASEVMTAANTTARNPSRQSIAYVDLFNQDAASRGMNVQKRVDPKTGAVSYTDGNPHITQQFTNHGQGIAGSLSGLQIGQMQRESDTADALAGRQRFERSQMAPADRLKADAALSRTTLDLARANKASAEAEHVGDPRRPTITLPQQAKNAMIDKARAKLAGMTTADVLAKTAEFTEYGRANPQYDPELSRAYRLANSRKVGDDPAFDAFTAGKGQPQGQATDHGDDLAARFAAEPAMKGFRMGESDEKGAKVFDADGNHVGYWN
jgi:hypothetical protein